MMVLGAFAFFVGGILALDVGGIGTRYIRLTLRRGKDDINRQAEVDRIVRRYKFYFGTGSLLGLILFTSGLLRS